jgi:hypothetical protein
VASSVEGTAVVGIVVVPFVVVPFVVVPFTVGTIGVGTIEVGITVMDNLAVSHTVAIATYLDGLLASYQGVHLVSWLHPRRVLGTERNYSAEDTTFVYDFGGIHPFGVAARDSLPFVGVGIQVAAEDSRPSAAVDMQVAQPFGVARASIFADGIHPDSY